MIEKKHLLNYSIFLPYLILSVLGLVVVYSSTSANQVYNGRDPLYYVINQGLFTIVSLAAIWFIYRLRLDFLKNDTLLGLALLVEFVLLIWARFFSEATNGAYGWVRLPASISLQPAEYLKLIIIWLIAFTFAKPARQNIIHEKDYQALIGESIFPRKILDWRIYTLLMLIFVIMYPDLGNATIVTLTVVIMFSASGIAYRWFTVLMGGIATFSTTFLGFIALVGVENFGKVPLFGYVAKRFSAFFNPFKDPDQAGHQLINSYYAMSNGGWFGRGLGNSIQKNGYLREAHTDFIFPIIIEEFGLIGAGLILVLLFFMILRIIQVSLKVKDPFNAMITIGVGGLLLTQTFINVGGVSGLIPSTGVTFPFFSQGGNSLLVISVGIGLVLNISATEKRDELYKELQSQKLDKPYFEEQDDLIYWEKSG